jgi:glutathionylspermidine synthase
MVTENIIKLCEKPIEEIHQMYISVIPKLIHNRNLLVKFAKEKKLYNEFIYYLTNTFEML